MSFAAPFSDPNYRALYIHIPFCVKRCIYCDFPTEAVAYNDPLIDEYVGQLAQTIGTYALRGLLDEVETIYIGGGTPSFIGPARLAKLLGALDETGVIANNKEFTIEANPESLTDQVVAVMGKYHVNRVSVGAQSFIDDELKALSRPHDSGMAISALDKALAAFNNVSLDIMCGIPHQTMDSLIESLDTAVGLGVQHISVYPLSVEEGTGLAEAISSQAFVIADDDQQADFMLSAKAYLLKHGFEHYEIASYARRGYRSAHNQAYWKSLPYLGIGKGAVGMGLAHGSRFRYSDQGIIEQLDAKGQALEDLMLGMRLMDGVPFDAIDQVQGLLPSTWECFLELEELQLVRRSGGYCQLTDRGWLLGNEVFMRILSIGDDEDGRQPDG
ncbi:MAG: radical SAM family heme chaperone HemW [Coriobacteriia bacterium]|nr:radical SAM family heme chaperone HemW [Coriobacteriia bacterium]